MYIGVYATSMVNKKWHTVEDMVTVARTTVEGPIMDDHVYDVFNASLVDHSPKMQSLTDKYFKTLTDKGYNAIMDVNDHKYSGYDSINPIIAFNTKGLVEVMSTNKVTPEDVNKAAKIGYAHIYGKGFAIMGAQVGATAYGYNTIKNKVNNLIDTRKIEKYRQSHPETKLSNTEIIRMIERSS